VCVVRFSGSKLWAMEKAVEGGNASRESSTAVSLDHLEDEEGPPSPKAIPELIHHSSPEARVADAEPAAGKKVGQLIFSLVS
jgi:hypothetical protein